MYVGEDGATSLGIIFCLSRQYCTRIPAGFQLCSRKIKLHISFLLFVGSPVQRFEMQMHATCHQDVSPDFYAWVFPKCDHVAVGTGTVVDKKGIQRHPSVPKLRNNTYDLLCASQLILGYSWYWHPAHLISKAHWKAHCMWLYREVFVQTDRHPTTCFVLFSLRVENDTTNEISDDKFIQNV